MAVQFTASDQGLIESLADALVVSLQAQGAVVGSLQIDISAQVQVVTSQTVTAGTARP